MKIFENKKKELDLEVLIDTRALICANSGGGKSFSARRIMEESYEKGMLSIIFDIEGEFRTLREKYDFLLVGPNGDIPLNPKIADKLPQKILEMNVPTIIDISDLRMRERITYVKNFLEALMELPKDPYWKPCLIFLDEAHMFCGQQEKQDSVHSVIDLMTRGRKRGYCGVLMTQRIAKLHKDAAAEANNYLVGRIGLDVDQKRAAEILGFTSKEQMLSLRDLEPGEFYVFGPAISKSVEKEKINETKTTHPKRGQIERVKISAPTEKIKSALSKLKELPGEVAKEMKDLNDYKIKIKELELENRTLRLAKLKPEADEMALKRSREQGYNECKKAMEGENNFLRKENDTLLKLMNKIGDLLKIPVAPRPAFTHIPQTKHEYGSSQSVNPLGDGKANRSMHDKTGDGNNLKISSTYDSGLVLGVCEKKIYSLLYQYSDRSFSKQQVGVFTGYSHSSGGFNNALGKLRSLGLIEGNGDRLKIKELNPELADNFDFSKEAIISKLGKCEKEIYDILLEYPDDEFSKEELAEKTPSNYSPSSGGFNNALGRLNTFGLIERNSGRIKLNPALLEI